MTDAMCNGTGCCAKRDCLRYIDGDYWRPTTQFEPSNGYHCVGFMSHIPVDAPEWTKRIPELGR